MENSRTNSSKNNKTKKTNYEICPRCNINYKPVDEKYCDVCKAELRLLDPEKVFMPEDDTELEKLCPICHSNLILVDEECCISCKKDLLKKKDEADIEWKNLNSKEEHDDIDLNDEELDEIVPPNENVLEELDKIEDDIIDVEDEENDEEKL